MITREETKAIADKIFKLSDADESEIIFWGGNLALTRFSEDRIHQNVAENNVWLTYRAAYGKKTAKVISNNFEDESLKAIVSECKSAAKHSPEYDGLLPLLSQQEYKKVNAFHESTAEMSPEQRADIVEDVMKHCKKEKLHAFGFFSNILGNARPQEGFRHFAVANSNGLFGYYKASSAHLSVTVRRGSRFGWAQTNSTRLDKIKPEDVVSRAAGNILFCKDKKDIKPGKYNAILSSQAVSTLFMFMLNTFNGLAVQENNSIFQGKLGKKVMADKITIKDDPYHPDFQGVPFDYEGVPRKALTLVNNGILENFVYDRRTASSLGVQPTGHGEPVPNQIGAFPYHVVIEGSNTLPDELIKSTDHGILINRIWYVRFIDAFNVNVTGLTRAGTYLIENGKITGTVRDFRFNQNLIELFKNVDMVSAVRKTGNFIAPAMKVRNFNFSSYSGLDEK